MKLKPSMIVLSLTFAVLASSCKTIGLVQPQIPPPPAALMKEPDYEKRLRQELFKSERKPMPKSQGFNQ